MKKIIRITALALAAAALAGCASRDYSSITGYDIIKTAKANYAALESGRLVITDNSDGKITQEFVFKYEGDALTYSYMGSDDATTYYEYHNGAELDYCDNANTAWQYLDASSADYYAYSRTERHPLTGESVISLSPDSISYGEQSEKDGMTILHYYYDVDTLNTYSSTISQLGTLTSFEAVFTIDAEGRCVRMDQIGKLISGESEFEVNYTMTVSEMNAVEKVVRPDPIFE